jgi:hypothetical protein
MFVASKFKTIFLKRKYEESIYFQHYYSFSFLDTERDGRRDRQEKRT